LPQQAYTLDSPPPALTGRQAVDIAHRYFGLRVHASTLVSERDQNFRLRDEHGSS